MHNLLNVLNATLLTAGAGAVGYLCGRLWRRNRPGPQPAPAAPAGPVAPAEMAVAAANSTIAGIRIRSRWESLPKIAKASAAAVGCIGALALLGALVAGVSPIMVGVLATLVFGVTTLTVAAIK
jgi:hypothetical protein